MGGPRAYERLEPLGRTKARLHQEGLGVPDEATVLLFGRELETGGFVTAALVRPSDPHRAAHLVATIQDGVLCASVDFPGCSSLSEFELSTSSSPIGQRAASGSSTALAKGVLKHTAAPVDAQTDPHAELLASLGHAAGEPLTAYQETRLLSKRMAEPLTPFKSDCFPDFATGRQITLGVVASYGFVQVAGGASASAAVTAAYIANLFVRANRVYWNQLHIWLHAGSVDVCGVARDSGSAVHPCDQDVNTNALPSASDCGVGASVGARRASFINMLGSFAAAERAATPNKAGWLFHHFSNCVGVDAWGDNIVGIAGSVGLDLCARPDSTSSVAATSYNSVPSTWSTFAHELGHNLGLVHPPTFYEYGGIMDYGVSSVRQRNGPTHPQEADPRPQFLPHLQEASLCSSLTSMISSPTADQLAATQCFDLVTAHGFSCGNGIVEPGEQCDTGRDPANKCCDASCQLTQTAAVRAHCAAGDCCDVATCLPKDSRTTCVVDPFHDSAPGPRGVCFHGECIPEPSAENCVTVNSYECRVGGPLPWFSGNPRSASACYSTCMVQNQCADIKVTGQSNNAYEDGVVCKHTESEYRECSSGTCVTATRPTDAPTGTLDPSGSSTTAVPVVATTAAPSTSTAAPTTSTAAAPTTTVAPPSTTAQPTTTVVPSTAAASASAAPSTAPAATSSPATTSAPVPATSLNAPTSTASTAPAAAPSTTVAAATTSPPASTPTASTAPSAQSTPTPVNDCRWHEDPRNLTESGAGGFCAGTQSCSAQSAVCARVTAVGQECECAALPCEGGELPVYTFSFEVVSALQAEELVAKCAPLAPAIAKAVGRGVEHVRCGAAFAVAAESGELTVPAGEFRSQIRVSFLGLCAASGETVAPPTITEPVVQFFRDELQVSEARAEGLVGNPPDSAADSPAERPAALGVSVVVLLAVGLARPAGFL